MQLMKGQMSESSKQIMKAATVVMLLFIISRLLGLVRQMTIGALFGTSGDLDAYLAAARVSETVFLVITGGALGSAFIPTFADHLAKEDFAGAWRLASAIVNLALVALTTVTLLIAILAPTLVRTVLAPGFTSPQQILTVDLLRLMLVSPIIFGVSGIVMGALNAHQHFLMPALAPSAYNLSIIGGALLLGPRLGVRGIAIGVVVGSVLHLLVQIPELLRHGTHYTLTLGLDTPGVREVGRLMAPRMLGTAIVQLNFIVNISLASRLGKGAVSAINYAWLLMLLPQGVFAQALGTAAFPTFAEQAAQGKTTEMQGALSATLRGIFFLCLPATVGLLVLSRPLVALLFERGAFEATSTKAVAWALIFYTLGLMGHAGLEIVARAFYALHDTFTPVWVGGLAMAINVALSLTLPWVFEFVNWPSHAGLALASSIAALLELAILLKLIQGRLGGLERQRILLASIKSSLAALGMGAILLWWRAALSNAGALIVGGGGVLLGTALYLLLAILLRVESASSILQAVRMNLSPDTEFMETSGK